ncbi:DNA polymerase Y family protein [Chitinimonas arctica]|uniref:DNA polymerase Y family protein n=1 Tax=Chitinimonas arctica TaxID=2594795 RepID=A0A516SGD1_9NEIS|nr:DNA polymerase Y family protein [Chitinimonas arctica]QDQ27192.1 DNA polymerase Y family protein [Chitinimonas arctica]
MLWLALHFPSLPLDALALNLTPTQPEPWAVVEAAGRIERVVVCNQAADALGIKAGQRSATAQALAANLRLAPRQPAQEQALLDNLAAWSLQFTPTVCLDPPAGLLLEIGGCLTYFKGLPRLRRLIAKRLAKQGLRARQGIAPTPLLASWLAQLGQAEPILPGQLSPTVLQALPLARLPLSAEIRHGLHALGLRQAGELLSLPRDSLDKRFGPGLSLQLDRALGLRPDPRKHFVAADCFSRRIELNWATDQVEALGFVAKRLLTELAGFLQGRGLGVQQLLFRLQHEDKHSSEFHVGLGKPTRSAEAMLAISRERLARLSLAAPVEGVTLQADRLHRLDGAPLDLFGDAGQAADFDLLHARLVARLGESAVRGLATVDDHRPEYAWQARTRAGPTPPPVQGERPTWLLPEPLPLTSHAGQPWHGGPLRLLDRAERIESGWWDGDTLARDYHQAEDPSGQRYWIYRLRGEGRWFLHGQFA